MRIQFFPSWRLMNTVNHTLESFRWKTPCFQQESRIQSSPTFKFRRSENKLAPRIIKFEQLKRTAIYGHEFEPIYAIQSKHCNSSHNNAHEHFLHNSSAAALRAQQTFEVSAFGGSATLHITTQQWHILETGWSP